ncbi:hypothetical protein [Shouchella hunanensis]|uniref:Uncharacterized protein n=1 Tax=Shouchella hunanensis TaxID=766894 RepID=A0ABY7W1C8_9BACI|nr:hypothetical protein [Shouchella hunanensis]WDF02753.1 hypothetical protein PQ477_14755 [Shouchella hunanensis]
MSLITGVVHNDYVMLTGDRATIALTYDVFDDGEVTKRCFNTVEIDTPKVEQLTTKVLLGITGCVDIGVKLRNFLRDRIKLDDNLSECADLLEFFIRELETDTSVEASWFLSDFGADTSVYMLGFTSEGRQGIVSYDSGLNAKVNVELQGASDYMSFADGVGTKALDDPFELTEKQHPGILTFMQRADDIHRVISYANPRLVSQQYDLITLDRDGNVTVSAFSTEDRYGELAGKDVGVFVSDVNAIYAE